MQLHGGLLRVRGSGVLLLGPSGVGKSETALALIARGHQLVADDLVEVWLEEGRVMGRAREAIRHFLEIRGLGILCISDLYGPGAVAEQTPIALMFRLEHWREGASYERVGLERPRETILGVELPCLVLPVRPSASIATLVEAGVRDHEQRARGMSGAEKLDARLRRESPR
jgi:HPr kinase/phosphorylase